MLGIVNSMSDGRCIRDEPWNILCRVTKQEGTCGAGHKVGDEILFTGDEVKGKLCFSAMYSMIPKVYAMMYNARCYSNSHESIEKKPTRINYIINATKLVDLLALILSS
jgi:uncharacterized repeat protein (TIGR04076 family)